jgi:hypothetical protein
MQFSSRQAGLPDESACVEGNVFIAFMRLLSYQCDAGGNSFTIRDPLFAEEPNSPKDRHRCPLAPKFVKKTRPETGWEWQNQQPPVRAADKWHP